MSTYQLMSLTGQTVSLSEGTVAALDTRLHGELIRPEAPSYAQARAVWNGMIDRHPGLIARCTSNEDVSTAVNFARTHNLLVAVRGGGHNVAGTAVCDGGLVIDLSSMKGIQVNPEARTARAQAGVNWGELDQATQPFGLATPGGVVSDTGIAGLTLGGGLGWLRNKYGLSSDNLRSVEVVTADGQLRTASASENPDLFWAVRGGGGNFGVVTSFEYQLHRAGPEVMFCFVFYPVALAKEALHFYQEYTAAAPDEVSSFAIFGTIPHAPVFPTEVQGEDYVLFAACYAGSVEEGERVMQPLRDFSRPLADLSGPLPYVEMQRVLDEDYPAGTMRYYWKSVYLDTLSDGAIDCLTRFALERPAHHSTIDIWHLGGAMNRVGADETAFSPRDMTYLIGIEANWEDPQQDEQNIGWTRALSSELHNYSEGRTYVNFPGMGEEGDALVRSAYGANYARLAAIKRQYDPTNLFRLNQNIKPAEA